MFTVRLKLCLSKVYDALSGGMQAWEYQFMQLLLRCVSADRGDLGQASVEEVKQRREEGEWPDQDSHDETSFTVTVFQFGGEALGRS